LVKLRQLAFRSRVCARTRSVATVVNLPDQDYAVSVLPSIGQADPESSTLHHRHVDVGSATLYVAEAGASGNRPLVVLLHGFPEFWWSWRHQIPALADAGFHVVAPDMRGYHLSDKPRKVSEYGGDVLEADLAGLIRALGKEKAVVVGHDWGGVVAWSFAERHPHMLERLALVNAPHPERMGQGLRTLRQLLKSWYIFLYQLPYVPEWLLTRNDFRILRSTFEGDGIGPEAVEQYVEAAKKGENLRGAVNYYRASVRAVVMGKAPPRQRIETPTLVVWGERDRFLGKELAIPDPRWVPNARVEFLPSASHWVQHDAPEQLNELLIEFLADLSA
jgi:pimeloyl-ACP methyl ester carboxylesterase